MSLENNHDDTPTVIRPADSMATSVPAIPTVVPTWMPLEIIRSYRRIHANLFSLAVGAAVVMMVVVITAGPDTLYFREYLAFAGCNAVMAAVFGVLWHRDKRKESAARHLPQ